MNVVMEAFNCMVDICGIAALCFHLSFHVVDIIRDVFPLLVCCQNFVKAASYAGLNMPPYVFIDVGIVRLAFLVRSTNGMSGSSQRIIGKKKL